MSDELIELPEGWTWVKFGDITSASDKKVEPSSIQKAPYIGLEHIEKDTGKLLGYGNSNEVKSTKSRFYPGDLLYGKLRPYLNKVHLVDFEGVCSTDILVFPKSHYLSNEFLAFRFLSRDFVSYASQNVNGVQHPRVNFQTLAKFPIALPPLNEQLRIVAKIKELRARSQRVKKALEAIPPLLEQFRQSVLAAAFWGDLTADWRAQNPDVEPASVLLERIRSNHKRCQEKHRLIDLPDPSALPEIPSKWLWVTVEQGAYEQQTVLTGPFGATLGREDFLEDGVPVITIGCLQSRGLNLSKAMYISQEKADELERYKLKAGDFLFSRMASVGRAAIVEDLSGAIFNYHLMRLRLSRELIEAKYFLYYVRGASAVFQYVKDVNHGATRDGINTLQLSKMPVALPPFEEQRQIVQIIENYFNRTHSIDDFMSNNLEELQAFNQSILAKAFRGELVPQDPNDEPASVLLERIRAERAKEAEVKVARTKGNRGKRKAESGVDQFEQINLPGLE